MDEAIANTPVMSLDLLRTLTKDFSNEGLLGSGSFGKVYLGVFPNGEKVAVKLLKHHDMNTDEMKFKAEFEIMRNLRHKNVLRLVGCCDDYEQVRVRHEGRWVAADKIYRALCLEYMPNGNLGMLLTDECDKYDWPEAYRIIKGISLGLEYLHNKLKPSVYHLDLKPANILLDACKVPKIADFGLSRLFKDETTRSTKTILGTKGYAPPEFIDSGKISNKFDIFSLGVIMLKIIAGLKAYSDMQSMPPEIFINLVHGKWMSRIHGSPNRMQAYSNQVKTCTEIGISCVQHERTKRPTIQEVVGILNKNEKNFSVSADVEVVAILNVIEKNFSVSADVEVVGILNKIEKNFSVSADEEVVGILNKNEKNFSVSADEEVVGILNKIEKNFSVSADGDGSIMFRVEDMS